MKYRSSSAKYRPPHMAVCPACGQEVKWWYYNNRLTHSHLSQSGKLVCEGYQIRETVNKNVEEK